MYPSTWLSGSLLKQIINFSVAIFMQIVCLSIDVRKGILCQMQTKMHLGSLMVVGTPKSPSSSHTVHTCSNFVELIASNLPSIICTIKCYKCFQFIKIIWCSDKLKQYVCFCWWFYKAHKLSKIFYQQRQLLRPSLLSG